MTGYACHCYVLDQAALIINDKERFMINLGGDLGRAIGTLVGEGIQGQNGNPLGSLLATLAEDDEEKGTNMLKSLLEMVQTSGGISSVIDIFSSNGLGDKARSWVGMGPNDEIQPDQIQRIFGGSGIARVASALGVDSGSASSLVASLLPELVNQVTPEGTLSGLQDQLISRGLAILGKLG
jgi:uncharacterized protein YidB (DUF937 family)